MASTTDATPSPTLPEDQLLELLVQLQKTTPEQARAILNAQPAIGYALLPLMVKLEILSSDVVQVRLRSRLVLLVPLHDVLSSGISLF